MSSPYMVEYNIHKHLVEHCCTRFVLGNLSILDQFYGTVLQASCVAGKYDPVDQCVDPEMMIRYDSVICDHQTTPVIIKKKRVAVIN